MRRSANGALMLINRLRHWPNIKTSFGWVFAVKPWNKLLYDENSLGNVRYNTRLAAHCLSPSSTNVDCSSNSVFSFVLV